MAQLSTRDIAYTVDGTRMLGMLVAPEGAHGLPAVVLFHDAFGLGEDAIAAAHRIARLGFAVFAADVWGDRVTPTDESQIGPLIGGMVGDRPRWLARVAAAHATAAGQPEIDGASLVSMGFCFGGSSALEHLRAGGGSRAVIAIHPGLDLLADGWDEAHPGARVLLCAGAADPMATAEQRDALEAALTGAGIDWEEHLYSGTRHAFTSPKAVRSPMPDVVAYHPRNAMRAWAATETFLLELLAEPAAVPA
ncbi:dienelactone hydrolase family protein [Demequina sp. SYSU T00039]|uniref:Dienelactone hydrolase family protein n=1 Tax=Demequina lignilytica TaxID=3051663 RepID=A0AAW7M4P4_9MICO|nr:MULTISPECIES: dienelactone hydrolase family protein [unclassified Demequina]MDN4478972.1 dienelactone hydrolase family protein [Demequina sp. SYSU T00039-1]MDN4488847.1 dienelactone hydrolase family protein [Demequina sp. SYSU T00039]